MANSRRDGYCAGGLGHSSAGDAIVRAVVGDENCRHEEINIKTGQARLSRHLWFVKVAEHVNNTPLSLALNGETDRQGRLGVGDRENTFSPGTHHSPHYRYHGALWQAHQMEMIAEMYGWSREQQRDAARAILTVWQESGGYVAANQLL